MNKDHSEGSNEHIAMHDCKKIKKFKKADDPQHITEKSFWSRNESLSARTSWIQVRSDLKNVIHTPEHSANERRNTFDGMGWRMSTMKGTEFGA